MYLNTNSDHGFHVWRQRFPNGRIEQVTSGPTKRRESPLIQMASLLLPPSAYGEAVWWLHDQSGDHILTSEATATLADARNGSPFHLMAKSSITSVRPHTGAGE